MKLQHIIEGSAQLPDSPIYYRVLNVESGHDAFFEDHIDVLKALQFVNENDYGSITAYYNTGDGVRRANWLSNIPIEYYSFSGISDTLFSTHLTAILRAVSKGSKTILYKMNDVTEQFKSEAAQRLEERNLNPEFEFPETQLSKILKTDDVISPILGPYYFINSKGSRKYVDHDIMAVNLDVGQSR